MVLLDSKKLELGVYNVPGIGEAGEALGLLRPAFRSGFKVVSTRIVPCHLIIFDGLVSKGETVNAGPVLSSGSVSSSKTPSSTSLSTISPDVVDRESKLCDPSSDLSGSDCLRRVRVLSRIVCFVLSSASEMFIELIAFRRFPPAYGSPKLLRPFAGPEDRALVSPFCGSGADGDGVGVSRESTLGHPLRG